MLKEDDDSDDSAAAAAAETQPAQPNMFDTQSEEDEILKEAFYGAENDHVAA
jgi:hypothetical protein